MRNLFCFDLLVSFNSKSGELTYNDLPYFYFNHLTTDVVMYGEKLVETRIKSSGQIVKVFYLQETGKLFLLEIFSDETAKILLPWTKVKRLVKTSKGLASGDGFYKTMIYENDILLSYNLFLSFEGNNYTITSTKVDGKWTSEGEIPRDAKLAFLKKLKS